MRIVETTLIKEIENTCQQLEKEFSLISSDRKRVLYSLSEYFTHKYQHQETPKAVVICTHNSRRSHLGQIWLAVGAAYFGLPKIETFSGGTEATAFNIRAVNALRRIGFDIVSKEHVTPSNPIYEVNWVNEDQPYRAFSKKYDSSTNPVSHFAAVMVCTSADKGCPVVLGSDFRLALPFEDPKAFDDTPLEQAKYTERAYQIGREMLFVMSQVRSEK